MNKQIYLARIWVRVLADNSLTNTWRTTCSGDIHPLRMLIWMALLIGMSLPEFALANCEGTGPCYCTPGTSVCTNTPPPGNSSGGSGGSSFTPQDQMLIQGAGVLGNAIGEALRGNTDEDARRQAEQAAQTAEAKRQEIIQEQQKDEARDRLLGNSQGGNASSSLSLMGVDHSPGLKLMTGDESISPPVATNPLNNAATTMKHSEAFNNGFQDASQCYSQNAGSRCANITGEKWKVCLSDYRSGYKVGEQQQHQNMDEATRIGQSAGESGKVTSADSDPRGLGPCRSQWIEAYNRGYFHGKQSKSR